MYRDGTPEEPVEKCGDCDELIVTASDHYWSCKYSNDQPPWCK